LDTHFFENIPAVGCFDHLWFSKWYPKGPNDSPVEQVWRSVLQFMYQGAGQYMPIWWCASRQI
jgi:hypothetical protein